MRKGTAQAVPLFLCAVIPSEAFFANPGILRPIRRTTHSPD